MDLSLFATQKVQTAPLSGGNNPILSGNGLSNVSFLEAILGNLDGEIKAENQNLQDQTIAEEIKKEEADLTLLQLALLGQDVDKNLDEKLAELKIEKLALAEENRIAQLTKLIDHLTNGLPQEVGGEASIEDLVSRLNGRLEELSTSLSSLRNSDFDGEDSPFKLLIATGLNPAQLTNITNRIEEVEAKLGRELTVEDLIAGVGNIIPVPEQNNAPLLNPTLADNTILPEDGITPLPQALSNAEFKALFGGKNNGLNNNLGNQNTAAKLATGNIVPNVAVPKLGAVGNFVLPADWHEALLSQQALSEALGFDVQTGVPFTQTMQAAHATTIVQNAGQIHPGTNMVATQMTKAAQTGDTRNVTLHLDPPELGRVEVRMEFGHDKQVKAHLIIEKPETYLMLQRDAAALDRALQNAGMETGADSLNYEMAEENYNFGDDKNGRGNNSGTENANHNRNEIDEEVIETTMNWHTDPRTGHVHYNIMA